MDESQKTGYLDRLFGLPRLGAMPDRMWTEPTGWIYVDWDERCHGCRHRFDLHERAWLDQEIEAVFCETCHAKYKDNYLLEPEIETPKPVLRPPMGPRQAELPVSTRVSRHTDHTEYLSSPAWLFRRNAYLAAREQPYECDLCHETQRWTGTQRRAIEAIVHHTSYENRGAEPDDDLALLCQRCHLLIHTPGITQSRAHKRQLLKHRNEEALDKAIYRLTPGPQIPF